MPFDGARRRARTRGHPPTKLETDAVCTLGQTDAGYRITTMQLTVRGEVEGIGEDEFESAAKQAVKGCPVSNALTGVEISMEASLA
jgi:Predicted redox protein, regulator of disulfide bond formation